MSSRIFIAYCINLKKKQQSVHNINLYIVFTTYKVFVRVKNAAKLFC